MNARTLGFACTLSLALLACSGASTPGEAQVAAAELPFAINEIGVFESPWAMAFLPDGKILVTQKMGAMILFDPRSGAKQTLAGTPAVVSAGQGALMDVVPAPDFARSRKIYFSYAEAGEGKTNGVALATATLDAAGSALKDVKVIFRATPYI